MTCCTYLFYSNFSGLEFINHLLNISVLTGRSSLLFSSELSEKRGKWSRMSLCGLLLEGKYSSAWPMFRCRRVHLMLIIGWLVFLDFVGFSHASAVPDFEGVVKL